MRRGVLDVNGFDGIAEPAAPVGARAMAERCVRAGEEDQREQAGLLVGGTVTNRIDARAGTRIR